MNDASLSLPLLQGLSHRPDSSKIIVKESLRRYEAGRRIGRWISACRRRQQRDSEKKNKNSLVVSSSLTPLVPYSSSSWEHWIFYALRSSSLSVRQAACRILLQGISSSMTNRGLLRDAIRSIVQSHVLTTDSSNRFQQQIYSTGLPNPKRAGCDYDSSIQLVGLLTHLLVENTTDIQSFVAGGGLHWITKSILDLVVSLFPLALANNQESGNQHQGGQWQTNVLCNSSVSSLQIIQKRIVLLVDLCYRLVLYASMPSYSSSTKSSSSLGTSNSSNKKLNSEPGATNATTTGKSSTTARARSLSLSSSKSGGSSKDEKASKSKLRSRSLSISQAKSSSSDDDKNKEKQKQLEQQLNKEASTKRLAILRKVQHLLWKSTIPAVRLLQEPQSQEQGETKNEVLSLSPLACLIYAHEVLCNLHPLPAKIRGMDTCISMLSRLVSPSSSIVISTSSQAPSSPTTSSNAKDKASSLPGDHSTSLPSSPYRHGSRGQERRSTGTSNTSSKRTRGEQENNNPSNRKRYRSSSNDSGRGGNATISSLLFDQQANTTTTSLSSPGGVSSSNERSSSAAAAMARAVSAAMEALEGEDDNGNEQCGHGGEVDGDEADEDHDDMDVEESFVVDGDEAEGDDDENGEIVESEGEEGDEDEEHDDEEEEDEEDHEEGEDDEDEEGEDEHDIVIDDEDDDEDNGEDDEDHGDGGHGDDVVRHLLEMSSTNRVAAMTENTGEHHPSTEPNHGETTRSASLLSESDRKNSYIVAAMQVLGLQYTHMHTASATGTSHPESRGPSLLPRLSQSVEQSLLKSICDVVKPPKKPLHIKMFLKRAPTQEEFFRGSLSRNPISLSSLNPASGGGGSGGGGGSSSEATVRDLRQYIANDLQMSDSAELLELLVANKILDLNLKLRVVQQVLWKNHLMENSSRGSGASERGSSFASALLSSGQSGQIVSMGPGLSMVFSSSLGSGSRGRSSRVSADTPASALPPMVITYRLAGVDGEATEDNVDETNLKDPEAPSPTESAEEYERLMEKNYGVTRLITEGKGVSVLLHSVESNIIDVLRRIRRDDVSCVKGRKRRLNLSRAKFSKSPPSSALTLLQYCGKLSINRKKLVEARAPTILLRLLLDVLNSLDEPSNKSHGKDTDSPHQVSNNPTAEVLEDLIETLASDISTEDVSGTPESQTGTAMDEGVEQDESTLPLLLSSLHTISLNAPLRRVISKLLPFLTYGQNTLSKELALDINKHVNVSVLRKCELEDKPEDRSTVVMETFVQTVINLPPSEVCHTLREELVKCGFVQRIAVFALEGIPNQPPPWSPALWSKAAGKENLSSSSKEELENSWRSYFQRGGLRTAFQALTGLCSGHAHTQSIVGGVNAPGDKTNSLSFLKVCHWIETTSDNASAKVSMKGMGILAETLLDEIKENRQEAGQTVKTLRKETKDRKKELANERRSKALGSMKSSFGPLMSMAGMATGRGIATASSSDRGTSVSSSLLNPVSQNTMSADNTAATKKGSAGLQEKGVEKAKPSWLEEMEALEEETGLTCAVCHEGRTLQPTELLGLYSYVKKVSFPSTSSFGREEVDGTDLLTSLPPVLPNSLVGTSMEQDFYQPAKIAGESLQRSSHSSLFSSSSSQSKRPTHYITTVSAGNAIHCTCHASARSADRNHPKAPKSEWEGAALRNSRVSCNAILPLVSSRSSKVNLIAVELALTDYTTVISNMLGARPRSMLWTVLHDIRLLTLRISYGEPLNADCGGGSISSNSSLLYHELFVAYMFANESEIDAPETARHARNLSGGFLAAYEILHARDVVDKLGGSPTERKLRNGMVSCSPMAALCCILFNNTNKSQWEQHKDKFFGGLVGLAGKCASLGVKDSGCISSRGSRAQSRSSSAFADWDILDHGDGDDAAAVAPDSSNSVGGGGGSGGAQQQQQQSSKNNNKNSSVLGKRSLGSSIDEYATKLRPMITLYSLLDQLSTDFVLDMTDEMVEESAGRIAQKIDACQRAKSIHELLRIVNITLDHETIMDEYKQGTELTSLADGVF